MIDIPSDTEIVDACVICEKSDRASDSQFKKLLGLTSEYGVKYCKDCELRWLSPRPTQEAYSSLYQYENYFESTSAVEDYSSVVKSRLLHFRKRIKHVQSFFSEKQKLNFLDVGAATGEFIHEAIKLGHHAAGIEISEGARETAKKTYGIELLPTPLEEFQGDSSYDVIHLNHVLEHLPNPNIALSAIYKLLKSDGILIIEVPQQLCNDLDRLKRLFFPSKQTIFNTYSLHHTFFFTPTGLQKLLEQQKFSVVKLATSNFSRTPLWPFNLKNYILGPFLALSDLLHRGGNIIEVYAKKKY